MAKKKEKIPDLTFEDLKVNQVYRSKKPRVVGLFHRMVDDREIIYISQHKTVVGHIDHGYTPEFDEWCKQKAFPTRFLTSEYDQLNFEAETNKSAKNIETLWDYLVQYNSPVVKNGSKYPSIPASKFIKWAAKNVTELMPPDKDWASTL